MVNLLNPPSLKCEGSQIRIFRETAPLSTALVCMSSREVEGILNNWIFIQDISIITKLVLYAVFEIVEFSELCLTELRLYLLGTCTWEECDSITQSESEWSHSNSVVPRVWSELRVEGGDKWFSPGTPSLGIFTIRLLNVDGAVTSKS